MPNGTRENAMPPSASTCRTGTPAIKTMPTQTAPKTMADPMSGSANTSAAGTAAIAREMRKTVTSFMRAWRSAR